MKYIFVVGGVISSVGKGITSASIAKILKSKGYRVTNVKCDMYVNIDAGTINPGEHGEVFVGEDGIEADQDLGNYERFTGQISTRVNYITTGQVYQEVIRKERSLEYNGEDVEVVPDIPNEIIRRIKEAGEKNDAEITIIEFGGTIGEYQVLLFLEAARIMKYRHPKDVTFVVVSYLPIPSTVGEMKSKPTQLAIRELNATGIHPDFIVCRASVPVDENRRTRIAVSCSLDPQSVVSAPDVESIYEVPLNFEKDDLGNKILYSLNLKPQKSKLEEREKLVHVIKTVKDEVKIGIVGKYFMHGDFVNTDTYISVIESIKHASWSNNRKPVIQWINSETYEKEPEKVSELSKYDCVIVPGGFGTRGIEGKIIALKYIRENNIPYLGLCYGMQLMAIEFARNVSGLKDSASQERGIDSKNLIISTMSDQIEKLKNKNYGATMRLGSQPCLLLDGSLSEKYYKEFGEYEKTKNGILIHERHRHRYEFNNDYKELFEKNGLKVAGINPDLSLVEILENRNCKYMLGSQFHPEFKSRIDKPHPLFLGLIENAIK